MLGWRLLLGPLLAALLAAVFWMDAQCGTQSPVLLGFGVLLAVRATWELAALVSTRSFKPCWPLLAVLNSLIVLASAWPVLIGQRSLSMEPLSLLTAVSHLGPPMLMLTASFMLLLAWRALRFSVAGGNLETLGADLLCLMYVGGLLSFLMQMRWVRMDLGYVPLASIVVATKCGDIAAYTCGRLFGRQKLIPLLSPGKTWAGAWGALAGSSLGSWAFLTFGVPWVSQGKLHAIMWAALVYGIVMGFSGLIGDLCESLMKRDVGQKDSAPLLPGFGGLLDLLDSVIFSGPVALLLWLLLPLTGM